MKNRSAFSLTQIAISMIIIGVLSAGISKGLGLVSTAKIGKARDFTINSQVPKISGLVAWYETTLKESLNQSETTDNAQITAWYDINPSSLINKNNKLTKAASAGLVFKKYGINKIPSLKFNGTSNITLATLSQGSTSQATVFLVFQSSLTPPGATTLLDNISTSNSFSISFLSDRANLNAGTSSSTASVANSFIANKNYVLAAQFNGASSKVFVNDAINSLAGTPFNAGTNPLVGLTIGSIKDGSQKFNGLISEIIIYNRPLKDQEQKDVMKYLSLKYDIAVTNTY